MNRGRSTSALRDSSSRRWAWPAALALISALVARGALAGPEGAARARVVELTATGPDGVGALVTDATRELVGRLGLALRAGEARADSDALIRASVDLRDPAVARVNVIDLRSGQSLVARAIPRSGPAAVVAEQIAHVIHAAAESALATARREEAAEAGAIDAGGLGTMDAAPAAAENASQDTGAPIEEPDAGRPVAVESPRAKGFAVDAVAMVDGTGLADPAGVVFGAGGGARLALGRAMWRPSILLTVIFHPTIGVVQPEVELRTTLTSIRVMPSVSLLDTRWVGVDVGAGLGVDVVDVSPRRGSIASILATTGSTNVDPIVRGGLGIELRLLPWAAIFSLVSADMDLQPYRYVVDREAGRTTVLEPWRVRPSIMLGVRIALFEPKSAPARPASKEARR